MKKTALFVFNGDPMCFIHVLLNALDLSAKGHEARIVVEGAATQLLPQLAQSEHPLNLLWSRCLAADLVAGVCRACANKMGTTEAAEAQNLPLLADMNGHPAMSAYMNAGYEIITF
ncbi:MAG: DsrE family protein [Desulfosarcinaceae bacterium]|jgi:hypothetical protein